jgi:GNAT superfamily N-acetyltransferase
MNPDTASFDELAVERVDEDNFDEFLYLVEKLAEYERLDPPDEGAKARLKADGLSDNPRYEAYLGRIDGQAVSYAIFFMTYSSFLALPTLYLEDIFVLEEFRRRDIGQKLFEFCVHEARDRGCGRIEWMVLDWNEPAIKFYEKNGAKALDWTFFRMTEEEMRKLDS